MSDINRRISEAGVVPVIKLNHPERDAALLARALCAGGIPVAEITFRAAGADLAIRIMKETCPEMTVGAGTVLTREQIDRAQAAGAEFIVTPGFDPELVAYCQQKGLPVYPGCTTPTDYHAALKFGLEVLKFFPAEQSGGLSKIKAMRHFAQEPEGVLVLSGGGGLRRLLYGCGRADRWPALERDHRAVPKIRGNRKGGPQPWLKSLPSAS